MNLPRADGRGSTSASAGELFGAIAAARNEVTVVGCEVEPGAYGRAKHLMRHHTCETRRQYNVHGRGAASQIPRSCHVGARDSRTEPSAVKYEIEWNLRQTVTSGAENRGDARRRQARRRASKSTASSSVWRLRRRPTAARCHSRERRGRATELDNAKALLGIR